MRARFKDGGIVGELMLQLDWNQHPLGEPDHWPEHLRTVTSIMLGSHQPMFICWGDSRTLLYNDAYSVILGKKHPWALGQPMYVAWSEIWSDIVHIVDRAFVGQGTHMHDFKLIMERNGYPEETYFSFSYTPIFDNDRQVQGMFCACTETTEQMQVKRLLEEEAARTRQLFNQTPGFIATLVGPDHRYEFVNRAYHDLVGHNRVVIGEPIGDILTELHSQGFVELLSQVFNTAQSVNQRQARVLLEQQPGKPLVETFVDFIFEPIKDKHGVVTGIFMEGADVTERVRVERGMRRAMEHQQLLMDELNHRVKNTLATVQSMAAQTFKGAHRDDEARSTFEARLFALAKAHDVLTKQSWGGADLREIVDGALRPYRNAEQDPFVITGDSLMLSPRKTLALTMALHEMATNAVKYGALSVSGGQVVVQWEFCEECLRFEWKERNGPPVTKPTRRGFGSRLIMRTLAMELCGDVAVDYPVTGFHCAVSIPHKAEAPGLFGESIVDSH